MSAARLLGALLAALLAGGAARGQEREPRLNVPDGPAIPGVEHGSFRSPSMDLDVGYNVALPAEYGHSTARYPVLYFLHGAGGNEHSDAGGFSALVRRQVEAKRVPPVICVFPNGGMSGYQDRPDQKVKGETLIVKELVPLIDRKYRTLAKREGRALAGFSMGGAGAVRLALKHPDLFSAAASWGGAFARRGQPAAPPEGLQAGARRVRLLLIVGDQDFTYAGHAPLVRALEEAGAPARYRVLPGVGHNLGAYYAQTGEELVRFLGDGLGR